MDKNKDKGGGVPKTSLRPGDHSFENDKRMDKKEQTPENDPTRGGYETGKTGTSGAQRPPSGMSDSSGYRKGDKKDYHKKSEDEKDMKQFNPDETENQETEFRKEHSGKDRKPEGTSED